MTQVQSKPALGRASDGEDARVLALFGPTSVGKTGVVLEVARALREQGLEPIAVNCDAIQIYQDLTVISGAAGSAERGILEHRLLGEVSVEEEMSAGRYAEMSHREIDGLLEAGKTPIVVGGTGLWLRAALCDLDLQAPVPKRVRGQVEAEMEHVGSVVLHRELPAHLSRHVHPNDRNRVARWTALVRSGIEPNPDSRGLWTAHTRHPTRLVGLIADRSEISDRIDGRVTAMAEDASQEARALLARPVSRTAAAAIGIDGFARGDLDAVRAEHRSYAKRQVTWMKKLPGVEIIDRTGLTDRETAARVTADA